MTRRPRRNHSPALKAKVAVDAIRVEKTLVELTKLHDVHPNQIMDWKTQLLERAAAVVAPSRPAPTSPRRICQDRPAGAEDRFFVRRAHQGRPAERKAMIDRNHSISIIPMNPTLALSSPQSLATLVASAGERAGIRFLELFASNIRSPNTRRAYAHAVSEFLAWCAQAGVGSITAVQPLHVATWIEWQTQTLSAPTVKQHLAKIRQLFDWLVIGQIVPHNPAASVRGPRHSARQGKTTVLEATEARQLLDSIDVTTPIGLRDRALIALMVFSFARIGAAVTMRMEYVYVQNRRLWVRLHEKRGKYHETPRLPSPGGRHGELELFPNRNAVDAAARFSQHG